MIRVSQGDCVGKVRSREIELDTHKEREGERLTYETSQMAERLELKLPGMFEETPWSHGCYVSGTQRFSRYEQAMAKGTVPSQRPLQGRTQARTSVEAGLSKGQLQEQVQASNLHKRRPEKLSPQEQA